MSQDLDTAEELGSEPQSAPAPEAAPAPVRRRRSIITSIATGASRRWKITLAFFIVVLVSGAWAFSFGLAREGFPPINTPISVVSGTYLVDDAERVDDEVVLPLVDAFSQVEGVVEVSSESRPSSFGVFVEFEDSIDSSEGTALLEAVETDVPAEAIVQFNPVNAAKFVGQYDSLVSIVGPADATPADFQEQASLLAEFLAATDEIDTADVRDLITEQVNLQTGESESRVTRFTRVAIGPEGYQSAIAVGLIRAESSDLDVLGFNDEVNGLLADETVLADGYRGEITADFAVGVRQQLSSLTTNLLTGLAAVALVSLLLIGWRVALITAGFMGAVTIGSLMGLWTIGYTLNTITLFGLIISLGLLVDDAIVISESIDANKDEPDPDEADLEIGAIKRAIDRVGSASFAGTLTTVVVFSPMLFVGGILGEFIRPIPATVIVTLLLSFLFSIVFIPFAARWLVLRAKGPNRNPVMRAERAVAQAAGRLAGYPSGKGRRGFFAGFGLAAIALVMIIAGGQLAGTLGFSIFPEGKDSTGMSVSAEFDTGTTIEEADAIAMQIDEIVVDVLGDELDTGQYLRGNERLIETFIDLTPIDSRSTTAPEFVERIEARTDEIAGARVTVNQVENGPPVLEFPFAVQIDVTDDTVAAGQALAEDIQADLLGQELEVSGDTVTVTDAIISTDGVIARTDGAEYIEVRAQYDVDDGLTGILNETEAYVASQFPPEDVAARGLSDDALTFDFGLESDNQDDFAALGIAGLVALILMFILITVQFRSLAQSVLIFLAIPFGFFGVTAALSATDNPLSFLSTVGLIALIGVAVNNTILLVDAANQERNKGATAGEAIQSAVTSRFRPLVATTITTVAGLLPLSLSDPFWESLGFTIMGGLLSSTFLVIVSFPAFYLGLEAVRTPLRNAVRRRRGKDLVA